MCFTPELGSIDTPCSKKLLLSHKISSFISATTVQDQGTPELLRHEQGKSVFGRSVHNSLACYVRNHNSVLVIFDGD